MTHVHGEELLGDTLQSVEMEMEQMESEVRNEEHIQDQMITIRKK